MLIYLFKSAIYVKCGDINVLNDLVQYSLLVLLLVLSVPAFTLKLLETSPTEHSRFNATPISGRTCQCWTGSTKPFFQVLLKHGRQAASWSAWTLSFPRTGSNEVDLPTNLRCDVLGWSQLDWSSQFRGEDYHQPSIDCWPCASKNILTSGYVHWSDLQRHTRR